MNRRGNTIIEYAIIIGLIVAALTAMNTFMKRGLQGKIKDMTDYYISNQQVEEMDPTIVERISQKDTLSNSTADTTGLIGGAVASSFTKTDDMDYSSKATIDDNLPFNPFNSADKGLAPVVPVTPYVDPNKQTRGK